MTKVTVFIALLKREILEHKNLWRVPLVLIGIAVLFKLSLSVGNLAIDIDVPSVLQLDNTINKAVDGVIAKGLNTMNLLIMVVMFVVAIFYALTCLYNERQDQSVLFWRSLPVSDSLTVASKLAVALVLVPVMILVCQAVVAILFFGTDSVVYLLSYYGNSLVLLGKVLLWSMLPVIAWCVCCSEIAHKNPFMLAVIAPILLILVDKLFLNGMISQTFLINRLTGIKHYTLMPLLWGMVFSAVCLFVAVVKRSQRI